ncbi:MAG: hypothetical protein IKC16_05325 [Clostridia bacterium]|nr:hypothetical protein [Clostridia bacterium]
MLRSRKSKIIALSIFALIQTVYLVLVIVTGRDYFTSVLISASFMILSCSKTKSYLFMQIGLACTVFADIFLVVIEPMIQLPAMIFFSGTQICYFLRIFFETKSKKEKLIHLIIRASLTVLVQIITIIVLKEKTDALSLVSMFYYTNLILNVIFAFVHFKKSPVLAIGLLLFLLCDTIIGLDIMASSYISGTALEAVNSFISGANWAWIFYVPSQALIASSLIRIKEKK